MILSFVHDVISFTATSTWNILKLMTHPIHHPISLSSLLRNIERSQDDDDDGTNNELNDINCELL